MIGMIVVLSDFCTLRKIVNCMFEKLRQKWKVNVLQLVLILSTFAIGGSLTGYAAKKIMNLLSIGSDWLWVIIYLLLVTIMWPIMVLLISLPFGQFKFFSNYTRKLGEKIGLLKSEVRSQRSEVGSRKSEVGD
jgi:uncharacterized protein DUF6787